MQRLLRLEVGVVTLALVSAVGAYLFRPSTIEFFAVIFACVAWTLVVVRALVASENGSAEPL